MSTEAFKTNIALTHLKRLEAESIHILREVVAEAERPVMLYSVGKDSAVMLHLARKAFYPSAAAVSAAACRYHLEVPGDVQAARAAWPRISGMELLVYQNPEAKERRASIPSIMARCTPTCGRPRG